MSMKANSMQNLAIVYHGRNAYCINFVFVTKDDAYNLIKNGNIIDKGSTMNFSPNKTPVEIINEGGFGGSYFRDLYSGVNGKWYRNSKKEFHFLKDIDPKLYLSNYYDVNVNKYGVKCGTSLRYWKIKDGFVNKILMVGFNGIVEII